MSRNYFIVTCQLNINTFCINIVAASSRESIEEYYSGYKWVYIREANDFELNVAKEQRIPFIMLDINDITKDEALEFHRQMWTDMRRDLGDNPDKKTRNNYKTKWCNEHFPNNDIAYNCFLCEYARQQGLKVNVPSDERCKFCPIDWSRLSAWKYKTGEVCTCYHRYIKGDLDDEIYTVAPISDILVLPEKENQ